MLQRNSNMLNWYLSNIRLKLEENTIYQNRGSPQGGVAWAFLWLTNINGLLQELENLIGLDNIYAFADDLLLCCSSPIIATRVIRTIKDWSKTNKITMNDKKSAVMPLALRRSKVDKFVRNILNIPWFVNISIWV